VTGSGDAASVVSDSSSCIDVHQSPTGSQSLLQPVPAQDSVTSSLRHGCHPPSKRRRGRPAKQPQEEMPEVSHSL
jgi:hypothetical protein